jgi:hypothetical protein
MLIKLGLWPKVFILEGIMLGKYYSLKYNPELI